MSKEQEAPALASDALGLLREGVSPNSVANRLWSRGHAWPAVVARVRDAQRVLREEEEAAEKAAAQASLDATEERICFHKVLTFEVLSTCESVEIRAGDLAHVDRFGVAYRAPVYGPVAGATTQSGRDLLTSRHRTRLLKLTDLLWSKAHG